MAHKIVLFKIDNDTLETSQVVECTCDHYWDALELFDIVTRGVRGYYRCWWSEGSTQHRYSALTKNMDSAVVVGDTPEEDETAQAIIAAKGD